MAEKAEEDRARNREDGHEEGIDDEVREGFFRSSLYNTTWSTENDGRFAQD